MTRRPRHSNPLPRVTLLVWTVFAVGACNRLPSDAPARVSQGVEAVAQGNHAEAYWWWRPLADAGMADAQYHLGWLYANGNGLRVDVPKAIEWWQRAAQSGYTDAEFAIGMAYLNGETKTLKKDLGKALDWLTEAAGHGNPDAREIIARLVRSQTEKVTALRPGLLGQAWLGTPVRVTADTATIVSEPSRKAKVAAQTTKGTSLRRIEERKGWLLVVLPDDSGLGWISAKHVEPAAEP